MTIMFFRRHGAKGHQRRSGGHHLLTGHLLGAEDHPWAGDHQQAAAGGGHHHPRTGGHNPETDGRHLSTRSNPGTEDRRPLKVRHPPPWLDNRHPLAGALHLGAEDRRSRAAVLPLLLREGPMGMLETGLAPGTRLTVTARKKLKVGC